MPWKDHGVMEERVRFVQEWESGDWNMAELCRFYGVTRATGYKWIGRYESGGIENLKELSRAPHLHPNAMGEDIEERVLAIREKHPSWGAPKIRARMEMDHPGERMPAESTIGAFLKRSGLTVPRKRRQRSRPRSEPLAHAGRANAVWCVDFKGWFRTRDGRRIDPLTITDAYSRFLLRCQAVAAEDYRHSKPVIEAAFREYGLPERMRSDNGAPFGSNGESGLTALSVWLIQVGIVPEHIDAGKPQQNGRHERMHRTLKQETARPAAQNRRTQQERFDQFRQEYNHERPHQALGQRTPASVYLPSHREYPERLRPIEYPSNWEIRSISPAGQMRWLGGQVFVAHALDGERVGLEPIEEDCWRVWFSFYEIGTLDAQTMKIRRPSRRVS
jgi:transposase InsO family protein